MTDDKKMVVGRSDEDDPWFEEVTLPSVARREWAGLAENLWQSAGLVCGCVDG